MSLFTKYYLTPFNASYYSNRCDCFVSQLTQVYCYAMQILNHRRWNWRKWAVENDGCQWCLQRWIVKRCKCWIINPIADKNTALLPLMAIVNNDIYCLKHHRTIVTNSTLDIVVLKFNAGLRLALWCAPLSFITSRTVASLWLTFSVTRTTCRYVVALPSLRWPTGDITVGWYIDSET